jgi:uracil-DNA glycosylase
MADSLLLKELKVHNDWLPFLSDENHMLISRIEAEIAGKAFLPSLDKVLRFFEFPLTSVRVIILGQDPYPQPGVATGRAFEVGNLQSWSQPFKNISLKNILRALYKAYTGKVVKYEILKERFYAEFPVLPPGKLFDHWEKQGVLLLNTSFTCEPGKPGSHRKIWKEFSSHLLIYIRDKAPQATWFLWGTHAANAIENLEIRNFILSMHPMMCYNLPGRENDFLFGKQNCFEPFVDEIDWTGYGKDGIRNVQRNLFQK